jgi:hypothetical protein
MSVKPTASGNVSMGRKTLRWAAALIAISPASAIAEDLPLSGYSRAPMLAREPAYNLSRFYVGANAGVGWSSSRSAFFSGGQLGYDFRSGAFVVADAQKNESRWRQVEMDAALIVLAAPVKIRGAFDETNPWAFGGLASIAAENLPPAAANLAQRLARMGADRLMRDALLGPNGALSAGNASRSLAELGVVVQGVNDQPAADESAEADSSAVTRGPIESYPLSLAALADQQKRTVRFGVADAATNGGINVVAGANLVAAAPPAGERSHAFDASEGTRLDPLLNTTYDLNYAKVVPLLK